MMLTLYHYPGACSQVCVFALEEAGLDYELVLVDLGAGEQGGAAYMDVSPLGKVPALLANDVLITENAAIQTYIATLCPQAGLLPASGDPLALAACQAGFSFCGGTLHPIVRGLSNPARMTDGDGEAVRRVAVKLAKKAYRFAESRLTGTGGWWLGDWSIIDVYLNWTISVARRAGFDFSNYPQLDDLHSLLLGRPAFARMVEIERRSAQTLAARGPAQKRAVPFASQLHTESEETEV